MSKELFISELRALMKRHGVTLDANTEYAFDGEDELPCGKSYEFSRIGNDPDAEDYWTLDLGEIAK